MHRGGKLATTLLTGAVWTAVAHRELISRLVVREVAARYRGSVMGLLWSLLQPLAMLAVFTTVFGVVLKAKWAGTGSNAEFALVLFSGLLVFGLFSECLVKAPASITQRANLVKKVVFPLEVLAWVNVGSALFSFAVAFLVWACFYVILHGSLHVTLFYLPVVILPVLFVGAAVGWLLGALGVFWRDLDQLVGPLSMAVLFLSPVFFSLTSVPPEYQGWFLANPMTFVIEQARAVMLRGERPDWSGLAIASAATYLLAVAALAFFRRARQDFADAL